MTYLNPLKIIGLCFLVFACASPEQPQDLSRVTVEQGVLQGKTEGNLTVFKGVPFAKPPVGELRWKAPQPPESWSGTRQALEYGPSPPLEPIAFCTTKLVSNTLRIHCG